MTDTIEAKLPGQVKMSPKEIEIISDGSMVCKILPGIIGKLEICTLRAVMELIRGDVHHGVIHHDGRLF